MVSRRLGSGVHLELPDDDDECESLLGSSGAREQAGRVPLRQLRQQQQQHKRGRTHRKALGPKDDNSDDEDLHRSRSRPRDYFINIEVPQGASLQTLSLKYNVPVAELKRVNNIMKETELFAHSKLKIPVKPDSVLTEAASIHGFGGVTGAEEWQVETLITPLDSSHTSEISSPLLSEESEGGGTSINMGEYSRELLGNTQPPSSTSKQARKVKRILRNMDKDLELIRQKNEILVERSSSSSLGSPMSNGGSLVSNRSGGSSVPATLPSSSSGSHWKCNLTLAIVLVVLVIVIFLILEYANYEDKQIEDHHQHVRNNQDHPESGS